MRRTHIWQRRYQSRSDDWLCIGACAGTPGERVEMAVEEVGGLVANPLVPGSGMKRLLRGGIIHQGGSFLSLPACPSRSLSLSPFLSLVLSLCLSLSDLFLLLRSTSLSLIFVWRISLCLLHFVRSSISLFPSYIYCFFFFFGCFGFTITSSLGWSVS